MRVVSVEDKMEGGLISSCNCRRKVILECDFMDICLEDAEHFGRRLEKLLNTKTGELKPFGIQTIHINEAKKIMAIVFKDGTKEIVKCSPEDSFDPEIGFALAVSRRIFGSKTKVRKLIKNTAKVIKAEEKAEEGKKQ